MAEATRVSKFANFIKTLLLGGVLGASGIVALLLFGPEWFRGRLLSVQPQSTFTSVAVSSAPTSAPTSAPAVLPTSGPIAQSPGSATFEDIAGVFGEKEITQLAQLGVFDTTNGKFNPQQPITRAEFVRWLVRANNAIWFDQPDKMIREAEGGQSTFTDVPPTSPDFRYIQGVTNAGFAVGYDATTFKPDQPLTREQMIAIKIGVDTGEANKIMSDSVIHDWSDKNKISQRFVKSINAEFFGTYRNIQRTFGAIKTFQPQAPVTRAEAAVCLSLIGTHQVPGGFQKDFRTAEQALQARAKQGASPL